MAPVAALAIPGHITDGGNSYGVTKLGPGTLSVNNANPFHGGVTISQGTLYTNDGGSLGTGAASVASGAELDIDGDITLLNDVSIAGFGTAGAGALRSLSGNNSVAGSITLTDDAGIGVDAGVLTISGSIGDGGNAYGLRKVGGGILALAGNNSASGTTYINAGWVQVTGTLGGGVAINGGGSGGTGPVMGSTDQMGSNPGAVSPGGNGATGIYSTAGYHVHDGVTTNIELDGTTAGTQYDQILNHDGDVDVSGSALSLSFVNGYYPCAATSSASSTTRTRAPRSARSPGWPRGRRSRSAPSTSPSPTRAATATTWS